LRAALAASSSFQTWCSEEDGTGALTHIFYDALPPPASSAEVYSAAEVASYWPYAVIYLLDYMRERDSHDAFRAGGQFGIQLCQQVAAGDVADPDEIAVKLLNSVEAIITDLESLINMAGYLDFDGISIAGPPRRSHPDDVAGSRDEIEIGLIVGWGGGE